MQQSDNQTAAEPDTEADGPVAEAQQDQEGAAWTAAEFNGWRQRMTLKSHADAGASLGISSENARAYSKGKRAIPLYIRRLCETLEKLRAAEVAVPEGASDPEMVRLLAEGYAQEVRRRRPMAALTLDVKGITEMMAAALGRLGLVLAREQDVEPA